MSFPVAGWLLMQQVLRRQHEPRTVFHFPEQKRTPEEEARARELNRAADTALTAYIRGERVPSC